MQEFDAKVILGLDADATEAKLQDIREQLMQMGGEEFINSENEVMLQRIKTRAGELRNTLSRISTTLVEIPVKDEGVQAATAQVRDLTLQLDMVRKAAKDGLISTEELYLVEQQFERISYQIGKIAAQYEVKHRQLKGSTLGTLNVLRVLQDAPHGIVGMANNFNELAMSIGILTMRTGSLNGALTEMFGNFKKGPFAFMALVSVVTALLLKWDQMVEKIDRISAHLGLMSFAQASMNKAWREMKVTKPEEVYKNLTLEQARMVDQLRADSLPALREQRQAFIDGRTELSQFLAVVRDTTPGVGHLAGAVLQLGRVMLGFNEDMRGINQGVRETIGAIGSAEAAVVQQTVNEVIGVLPVLHGVGRDIQEQEDALADMRLEARRLEAAMRHEDIAAAKAHERQMTAIRDREMVVEGLRIREQQDRLRSVLPIYDQLADKVAEGRETLTESEQKTWDNMRRFWTTREELVRGVGEVDRQLNDRLDRLRGDRANNAEMWHRREEELEIQYQRRIRRMLGERVRQLQLVLNEIKREMQEAISEQQRLHRIEDTVWKGQIENANRVRELMQARMEQSNELFNTGLAQSVNQIDESQNRAIAAAERRMQSYQEFVREMHRTEERLALERQQRDELEALYQARLREVSSAEERQAIHAAFRTMRKESSDRIAVLEAELGAAEENAESHAEAYRLAEQAKTIALRRASLDRQNLVREETMRHRNAILDMQREVFDRMGNMDVFQHLEMIRLNLRIDMNDLDNDIEEVRRKRDEMRQIIDSLSMRDDLDLDEQERLEAARVLYQQQIELLESYLRRRQILLEESARAERRAWFDMSDDAMQAMGTMLQNISSASQTMFDIWKDNREATLKAEGRSQEELNSILEAEGGRRFESMKEFMISETVIKTLSAGVSAFESVWSSRLPLAAKIPMSGAILASTLATGFAQVSKIRAMTLGGGVPSAGASVGAFTVSNADVSGGRIAHFEATRGPAVQMGNILDASTSYTDRMVTQLKITYDDRTASHITQKGAEYSRTVNR
jgi:hypothetical protein